MSTSAFQLGLPTDIPWQRICVTEDMLDDNICDAKFLPKWHSSIAVFKYTPDAEYQTNPNHDVVYLKVSVSLTGYQPHDQEIEGVIDFDGMSATEIENVQSLLDEYQPCTGAIIQVMVQPSADDKEDDPAKYPYVLDFEPKKRELYEMGTDTKEKMSRSLQQLSIGKSNQSTQSMEVLDIDMGGSWSFGAEGSYAGTGGGLNMGGSSSGQWGTKDMNSHQTGVMRTTDNSNEKRETESFTTQISQLYHLLDSYHLGTNRALFLMEPRPHVIAQESGFVRGPRPMDGVQEFFLVIAKPKNHKDICVSVRLDTAHLSETDIMEHAYLRDSIDLATSTKPPEKNDADAVYVGNDYMDVEFFGKKIGERRYKCYEKTGEDSETYIVANRYPDYKIDLGDSGGYNVENATNSRGGYSVNVDSTGESLFARVWATSHKCYNDGGAVCVNCPDVWKSHSANSSLSLTINLKSREPIRKIGTRKYLLITTRGLCCCPTKRDQAFAGVLQAIPLDQIAEKQKYKGHLAQADLGAITHYALTAQSSKLRTAVATAQGVGPDAQQSDGRLTPAQANELSRMIKSELRSQATTTMARDPVPYMASDFFVNKLETRLRQDAMTRRLRAGSLADAKLDPKVSAKLEKFMNAKAQDLRPEDVTRLPADELQRVIGGTLQDATALRLKLLGVPVLGATDKNYPKARNRRVPKGMAQRQFRD